MIYRFPELTDKDILQEYLREHRRNNEVSLSASLGLTSCEYTDWVEKIRANASTGDEAWGKSRLYLCFDDERLIGLLSIRYELPEALANRYGHIGYGVRPSERKKGYATAMLRHALAVCRENGLDKVILGCYRDNLASAKTIEKNGGVLTEENDNYEKGRISRYYRIDL